MPAYSAEFVYEIIDLYSARIKAMQRVTNTFTKTTKTAGKGIDGLGNRLGKMSSKLANLRTGFAATMLTMGLKGAIKSSYEFETIMNKVEAVTQATSSQMVSLRKEAKAQGLATRFSAVQAAEGMAILGERGYKTSEILGLIPKVLTMATAGDLDMAASSNILTGTLKTFSLAISKASHVGNVFAVTAANSASNITDLSAAMVNAGPLAAAAGVSFEELASLVGAMAEKNIKGSQAGTLLMNAIRNLVKPSSEAIEVLQKLGFKKDQVSKTSGQLVSLTRLLELFGEKGVNINEIFRIFQVRGAKAFAALKGQVPVSRALIKKYEEQTYAMKEMADTMEQRVTGTTHRAISAFQGLKIAIGKGLEPMTMAAQKKVTDLFVYIAENPRLARNLGITLAIVTGLLISLTLVGVVLGTLAAGVIVFGAISLPVFAAVAASIGIVVAMIASLMSNWDDAKDGLKWVFGGAPLDLMAWNLERHQRKDYVRDHAKVLREVNANIAAGLSPTGQPRDPLTNTGGSPALAGQTVKAETGVTVGGVITVEDRTMNSNVTADPNSGSVPINVNPNMKY